MDFSSPSLIFILSITRNKKAKSPKLKMWLYVEVKKSFAVVVKKYGMEIGVKREMHRQTMKPAITKKKKSSIVREKARMPTMAAWLITGRKEMNARKMNSS